MASYVNLLLNDTKKILKKLGKLHDCTVQWIWKWILKAATYEERCFFGGGGGHIFTQRLSNSYITWTEHFYPCSDFKLMRSYISSVFKEFTMEFLFKKSPPVIVVRGFVANCYSIVYCTCVLFIIFSACFSCTSI